MSKTIVQVPVDKDTRDQAVIAALNMGFSSLQEPLRLFIKKLAQKELDVIITPKVMKLSAKAIKRYDKITRDIESDKTELFTANNVEELMNHLSS